VGIGVRSLDGRHDHPGPSERRPRRTTG
jgi:hypothetical protein